KRHPKWIQEQGYHALDVTALARRQNEQAHGEIAFRLYAKVQQTPGEIVFGGNRAPGTESHNMYVVVVQEIENSAHVQRVLSTSRQRMTTEEENAVWADGGRGMTLFCA